MSQSPIFEQFYPKNNVTIALSTNLEQKLKLAAKLSQKSEQDLIIEAIENHLKQFYPKQSCYDLAMELEVIGVAENLPPDLSTNPEYFEGFGNL